ncbi:MAG: hypothetical protein AMXMBFR72_02230 [Betaproteobacteria bacterium]
MTLGSRIADCGWRWATAWLVCLLPLAAVPLEINTATRAELEQLNGVGVAMAERVLNERAKAPFRDWDDLQRRVKGMRGARSERLQGQGVTVNGIPGSRAARDDERKR